MVFFYVNYLLAFILVVFSLGVGACDLFLSILIDAKSVFMTVLFRKSL